jgi:HK97 gp10 family phage protein
MDRALLRALSRTPEVKTAVRKRAEAIAADARRLAPVQSGRLREAITVEDASEGGDVKYRVGWDTDVAFYGWMVEAGTIDTPAQPHLRPAAAKNRGRG